VTLNFHFVSLLGFLASSSICTSPQAWLEVFGLTDRPTSGLRRARRTVVGHGLDPLPFPPDLHCTCICTPHSIERTITMQVVPGRARCKSRVDGWSGHNQRRRVRSISSASRGGLWRSPRGCIHTYGYVMSGRLSYVTYSHTCAPPSARTPFVLSLSIYIMVRVDKTRRTGSDETRRDMTAEVMTYLEPRRLTTMTPMTIHQAGSFGTSQSA
jgi:hypothetical protein